jgi:guanylate kinase
MKNIFIISGPSGAGEDSIIGGLEKLLPIERIVTTSTREMRKGETQGNPYYFISKEEFENRLAKGAFAEHAQQYNGNLYGVTLEELQRVSESGNIGIWKIEYKGVISAKKLFPEIKAIFITAPDLETLERRIKNRDNASEAYLKERMEYTKEWLKHEDIYDFKVVNADGELDLAIKKVADFISEHRQL